MNKNTYVEIRKKLDFGKSRTELADYFVFDLFLYGVIGSLFQLNSIATLLAVPLICVLMFRNFSLMHEASHGGLLKNKVARNFVGLVSGIACFLPYELWKKSHLKHHFWAGNYEQDPVLMIIKKYPTSSVLSKKLFDFFWRTGIPFAGLSQNIVFWINAAVDWVGNIRSIKSWFFFWVPISVWSLLVIQLSGMQLLTLFAGFYAYCKLVEIVNFPHHVGLYLNELGENHLPCSEQDEISRTCLYHPVFERLVLLNFNYHTEHHLYPDLPWHELAHAHGLLAASDAKSKMNVVSQSWIHEQQKKSFREFLFPDSDVNARRKVA